MNNTSTPQTHSKGFPEMFIAYTIRRNKLVETDAHPTREDAARVLFAKFPKLKTCETAVAYKNAVGSWTTHGQNTQSIKRVNLPEPKATKAEVLDLMTKLYRILNTADHETKADWMTADLAGEKGCARLDDIMRSKAFTDEERQAFLDNL